MSQVVPACAFVAFARPRRVEIVSEFCLALILLLGNSR